MKAILALTLLLVVPAAAAEDSASLLDDDRVITISGNKGGTPVYSMSCEGLSQLWGVPRHGFLGPPGGTGLRFVLPGDYTATKALRALEYDATLRREGELSILEMESKEPFAGRRLKQRYELDPRDCTLSMTLQLPPGAELEISAFPYEWGEEYHGLASLYSDVRAVAVEEGEQETLAEEGEQGIVDRPLAAGDWVGIRGRFKATMIRSDVPLVIAAEEAQSDLPMIRLRAADSASGELRLTRYAGAIERNRLEAVDPALRGMFYAMLWEPLRQLSFGLQWMLDRWQDLVGRAWLAILLLSLSVKLLMAPMIAIAERWQADVNRTKSLLEPELAAIRRNYKGEDAHNRTLAVYRSHGVSHFYTFKSLAGFLIQIPIFIAAFDMLGENFRLAGEGFLWIGSLSAPDELASLPFTLPFFGGHLNLLPIVMTLFTVLAARWQEDPTLSPTLLRAQRLRLYAMAGVFFVLLYPFPAAMVLYWTANNFWHLVRVGWNRLRRPRTAQPLS